MQCLKTSFCGQRFRRFLLSALFLFLVANFSGCNLPKEDTQEKIRNNTERSAIANETLVRIEGKVNKNNEEVQKLVSAFENSIKNVKAPKPFEIPEWAMILAGLITALLVPDALKKAGQGVSGGMKIIKKVIGKK